MATLINGNGFDGVTAAIDADFYGGLTGELTGILPIGRQMDATMINNSPRVYDGVIVTKEGRRIQIDYDSYDDFSIPEGTEGVTAYYIIGYKLTVGSNDAETCEQFVQAMNSASATIEEDMLKDGNAEVYISLYRVTQFGTTNTLGSLLLPKFFRPYSELITTYTDVSRLELTTPTPAELFAAMPDNSVAAINSDDMDTSALPNSYGVVSITKVNANRGSIQFISKSESGGEYRMFINSNGTATGTWIKNVDIGDVYYSAGTERLYFNSVGYITESKRAVWFFVPAGKRTSNIGSARIGQDYSVTLRYNGTSMSLTTIDVTGIVVRDNGFFVRFRKLSAIVDTNNAIVNVSGYVDLILAEE